METLELSLPQYCGQTFAFSTYVATQLRTVGIGFVPPQKWGSLTDWNERDAQTLCRMLDPMQHSDTAAARGKVFFVGSNDSLFPRQVVCSCYQTKDNEALPVFCGNSSSAAAALIGNISGARDFSFRLACEDTSLEVRANVSFTKKTWLVDQIWQIENRLNAVELDVLGHKSVLCSFLNDYLIVKGPLKVDISKIVSSEHGIRSLRSKIAVIDDGLMTPAIRFYNCNGQHGAAPQTGLATIALAARSVSWLAEAVRAKRVVTPGGVELIPEVSVQNDLLCFAMPCRAVKLKELAYRG